MQKIKSHYSSAIVIFFIISCVFTLTRCMNNGKDSSPKEEKKAPISNIKYVNFQQFAGSATCGKCHKKIYESHLLTNHFLTSAPASEKAIKGSFEKDKNLFPFNPGLVVIMEKRDSGLYQVA